jgi:hypothetical protein
VSLRGNPTRFLTARTGPATLCCRTRSRWVTPVLPGRGWSPAGAMAWARLRPPCPHTPPQPSSGTAPRPIRTDGRGREAHLALARPAPREGQPCRSTRSRRATGWCWTGTPASPSWPSGGGCAPRGRRARNGPGAGPGRPGAANPVLGRPEHRAGRQLTGPCSHRNTRSGVQRVSWLRGPRISFLPERGGESSACPFPGAPAGCQGPFLSLGQALVRQASRLTWAGMIHGCQNGSPRQDGSVSDPTLALLPDPGDPGS